MLRARGAQQPGPITELCRWLTGAAEARDRTGEEVGTNIQNRYAHTYTQ